MFQIFSVTLADIAQQKTETQINFVDVFNLPALRCDPTQQRPSATTGCRERRQTNIATALYTDTDCDSVLLIPERPLSYIQVNRSNIPEVLHSAPQPSVTPFRRKNNYFTLGWT